MKITKAWQLIIIFMVVAVGFLLSANNCKLYCSEDYNNNNNSLSTNHINFCQKVDNFISEKCSKKEPEQKAIIIEQTEDISVEKDWGKIEDLWKRINDKLKDKEKKIGSNSVSKIIANIDPSENADLNLSDQDKQEGNYIDDPAKGNYTERNGEE